MLTKVGTRNINEYMNLRSQKHVKVVSDVQEVKPKSFVKQFIEEQRKDPKFDAAYKVYKHELQKQLGIKPRDSKK